MAKVSYSGLCRRAVWSFHGVTLVEAAAPFPSGLSCNVLVLNRLYMAVRVVSARRAFSLLLRNLAEVIAVENAGYMSYDISSWIELSAAQGPV